MDDSEKLATFIYISVDKPKKKNLCVGHHYTQTTTNNVNKTRSLLQTTGSINLIFYNKLLCFIMKRFRFRFSVSLKTKLHGT